MPRKMRLSIKSKILLLTLGAAAAMALTYAWTLPTLNESIFQEKKTQVKQLVESTVSLIKGYVDQEQAGKMTRSQAQQAAKLAIDKMRYDGNNYFWINDYEMHMVHHPIKPALDGKNLAGLRDTRGNYFFRNFVEVVKKHGQGFVHYYWPKPGSDKPVPKLSFVKGIPQWGWIVGSGIYVDDVKAQVWNIAYTILGVVLVVFLVTIFISLLLVRSIVAPVNKAVDIIKEIAEGGGDLCARLEVASNDEIGALSNEFNKFVAKLHDLIAEVKVSTESMIATTEELSQGTQSLSEQIQSQASSIEEIASTMEEMNSSVKQEADHASQANELAQKTARMAEKGGKVVEGTVEAMKVVNESSKKINEIISVVNEIAFQTNLLALNAAVEAARAGEAGRGFAVVAGEVRNLAGRSSQAAKEIQTLISDSVEKVEQGNEMVIESGRLLTEIINNVRAVADTTGEITAAIQEQAQGITEINAAMTQMDQSMQQTAAMVEEAASASEEMASAGIHLRSLFNRFKIDQSGACATSGTMGGAAPAAKPDRPPKESRPPASDSKPASQAAAPPEPKPKAKPVPPDDDFFAAGLDDEGFEEF